MRHKDAWIQTYTGKKFYIDDPKPEDIDIRDIAHSLSMSCRFGGHCNYFYSVAEHCIRMVKYIYPRTVDQSQSIGSIEIKGKFALLHDAAEAYLRDFPKPLKMLLPEYSQYETVLLDKILNKFGVDRYDNSQEWSDVMLADVRILATEKKCIMSPEPDDWKLPEDPYDDIIVPLSTPQDAERIYLDWADRFGFLK